MKAGLDKLRDSLNPNKSKRDLKNLQEQLRNIPDGHRGSMVGTPLGGTPVDSPQPRHSRPLSTTLQFTTPAFEEVLRERFFIDGKGTTKKVTVDVAFGYKIMVTNVSSSVEKKNKAITGTVTMDVMIPDQKSKKDAEGNFKMVPETLAEQDFKSGQLITIEYEEKSDYHETVTFQFKCNEPDSAEAEIVIQQELKATTPEKLNLASTRQKEYFFAPGKYQLQLSSDGKEEEVYLSCKLGTKRPIVKRMTKSSDKIIIKVRKTAPITLKVGLVANAKDDKILDFNETFGGKTIPYTLNIQQVQDDSWITCWSAHINKVMKPYFIKLLTHFSVERNLESLEEIEKTAKANTQYSAMESIKNYSTKLRGKILKEDIFRKELNFAIEERNLNLRLERLIKESKLFNEEQFEGAGQLFQSHEMTSLIAKAEQVYKEVKDERNYVWKIREILANAWVEVKKRKNWNEDEAKKIFKQFVDEGLKFPNLKSHYFFVIQVWYDYLDKSIPNCEKVQYNILVFLKEQIYREREKDPNQKDFPYLKELSHVDTKLRTRDSHLHDSDIQERKKHGKLYKSYHDIPVSVPLASNERDCELKKTYSDAKEKVEDVRRVDEARKKRRVVDNFIRSEYSLFERIFTYIYKNSIDLLSQLRENEISHPIALSQALIDGDLTVIKELCEESRVLDLSEKGRAKVVINRIEKGQDYSDMLSQHEADSINRHVEKFQISFQSLAHLITKDMPLLKKVMIMKTKMSINVQEKERVIIPEILFLGDVDITFDRSIHEVPSKNWISELNKTGKLMTLYLKKKKDIEPHLSVHEIFMEQTTGINAHCKQNGAYFTSEMDQYVRKRILPILSKILDHRKKENYQTTLPFEVVEFLIQSHDPTKKFQKHVKILKESAVIEGLWQRTPENLGNVCLRMLLCHNLNHHRMNKFYSTLFGNPNLRDYYSGNSFMRRKETQEALLKFFETLDKFPFQMVVTMERNEYSIEKF